jgi:hypothetical protein
MPLKIKHQHKRRVSIVNCSEIKYAKMVKNMANRIFFNGN